MGFLSFEGTCVFSVANYRQEFAFKKLRVSVAVANDVFAIGEYSLADAFPYLVIKTMGTALALQVALEGRKGEGSVDGAALRCKTLWIVHTHEAIAWVIADIFALPLQLSLLEWHYIHVTIAKERRAPGAAC